ncbi:MAG: DUF2271 domain-containing protein [Burkholderiaceae bacterium]|jgi:hypothetical protein
MKFHRKPLLLALLGSLAVARAQAGGISLDIEIPAIDTAEYHRPYVAIWLENEDRSVVRDLSVWYDLHMAKDEGRKWLKDLRRWWRVSGRNQEVPADAVSGATRTVGRHTVTVAADDPRLTGLPAGAYSVAIEASREKGGHELVRLPLPWPAAAGNGESAQGERELGTVTLITLP